MSRLFWAVMLQTILLVYILFVPFYSKAKRCWDQVGGVVHFMAVHLVFLVIPMYVIGVSAMFMFEYRGEPVMTFLALFPILNASLILVYFFRVFNIVKKTMQWHRGKNWHGV